MSSLKPQLQPGCNPTQRIPQKVLRLRHLKSGGVDTTAVGPWRAAGLQETDAALMAGQDECARINDEQRQAGALHLDPWLTPGFHS